MSSSIPANPSRMKEHVATAKCQNMLRSTQNNGRLFGGKTPEAAKHEALTRLAGALAGLNVACARMPKVMALENTKLMSHVGAFPGGTVVRQTYLPRDYVDCLRALRDFVGGRPFSVLVDESQGPGYRPAC